MISPLSGVPAYHHRHGRADLRPVLPQELILWLRDLLGYEGGQCRLYRKRFVARAPELPLWEHGSLRSGAEPSSQRGVVEDGVDARHTNGPR